MTARIRVSVGGSTPPLALEFAPRGSTVYLRLSDARAVRTVEVEEGTLVDYDAADRVVGFEIVGLDHPNFVQALDRLKQQFGADAPQLRSVEAVSA